MDFNIEHRLNQISAQLRRDGVSLDDPVAKMMVSTLTYQTERIIDEINALPSKVSDRLCDVFIPRDKLEATPALALVQVNLNHKKTMEPRLVSDTVQFSFKSPKSKQQLNYLPLFSNLIVPDKTRYIVSSHMLKCNDETFVLSSGHKGHLWVGFETETEPDTLCGMSLLLRGTKGVAPKHVYVGVAQRELSFATMDRMEDIPMLEPFDSQQSSKTFFSMVNCWQNELLGMSDDCLMCITDNLIDRDAFKCRAFPKALQQYLEISDLDRFKPNTMWILLDFGSDYDIPDNVDVLLNVIPVVNVNVNSVTLTQSTPIAKLNKDDGSYFVDIVQTSSSSYRQGFGKVDDEVVIRDFDAAAYANNNLFAEIRNLYNHFIDDYHAFLAYNDIKDGETIRQLRELVNKIGRGIYGGHKPEDTFENGVYAMRRINMSDQNSITKVSYLTTAGSLGNAPKAGQKMDNRREPAFDKEVHVVVDAMCGTDKANADMRYELLRYYTMTEDRLFTRMDVDAYVRKVILETFGKEEYHRISYNITVQGAPGHRGLRRGLYIDIEFKDRKNYDYAQNINLGYRMQQQIVNKSCLSMPVFVTINTTDE